jgi:hypothetical protein
MSMETSKILSHISTTDDTWPTIARESMLHWDNIARDATFHWREKCRLFKRDEIVSEHVIDLLQQVTLPNAINFTDELHIFEVPSPVLNTAISSSIPLAMLPSKNLLPDPRRKSSSDIITDVMMTRLKKISSSLDEVTGHGKISPRANDVARILDDSFNPINSSDNGEIDTVRVVSPIRDAVDTIGTVRVVSPIRDAVDTYGDIFGFVESRMDILDEATDDIYKFLASLDSGVTVVTRQ